MAGAAAAEIEPPGQGRAERARRLQARLGLRLELERRGELAHRVAADDGEAGRGQMELVDIEEIFVEQLGIGGDAGDRAGAGALQAEGGEIGG